MTPIRPLYADLPTERAAVAALAATQGTRALAMWHAYERFCAHHDRARFDAEKQAIRDCRLIDFQEYRTRADAARIDRSLIDG